jgi:hypothetical protein
MSIPSLLKLVGDRCFTGCGSLSNLGFSSPSQLRELLDLPSKLPGFISIPDSVALLSFGFDAKSLAQRTLTFGSDSKLSEIKPPTRSLEGRLFVQVQTRSLTLFRGNLESKSSP